MPCKSGLLCSPFNPILSERSCLLAFASSKFWPQGPCRSLHAFDTAPYGIPTRTVCRLRRSVIPFGHSSCLWHNPADLFVSGKYPFQCQSVFNKHSSGQETATATMTQFRSPGYPAILRLPTALRRNAILCAVAFIFITIWLWVSNPCVGGSCHVNQTVEKLRSTVLAEDGFPKQFPKKIWQTSNITKADMWANQTASWLQQNPDWSYELITGQYLVLLPDDIPSQPC